MVLRGKTSLFLAGRKGGKRGREWQVYLILHSPVGAAKRREGVWRVGSRKRQLGEEGKIWGEGGVSRSFVKEGGEPLPEQYSTCLEGRRGIGSKKSHAIGQRGLPQRGG